MARRFLQKHCRRYLTSRPDFNLEQQSCLLKLNTGIHSNASGETTFDEILKSANDKAEYFVGRVPLIGIGEDNNCSYMKGPRNAPNIIRQAFLSASGSFDQYYCNDKKFINTETLLLDCGNLECNPNDSEANHNDICQTVQKISQINNTSNATDGRAPHPLLVLGGDHSITYPVLLGHQQASAGDKIAVINFNAHPDLVVDPNNMYSHAAPFYNLLETDTIHHLLQIGLRCMTKQEEPIVYKYKNKIKQLHMEQLFGFGVADYYQQIYDQMNLWMRKCHLNNITKFYISIDLDVLEPCNAPGISHYEPLGLSSKELFIGVDIIMKQLYSNAKNTLIGCDIVEYNPDTDYNYMTAFVAAKLMKRIAANIIYFSE